ADLCPLLGHRGCRGHRRGRRLRRAGATRRAAAHLRGHPPLGERRHGLAVGSLTLLLPAASLFDAPPDRAVALGDLLRDDRRRTLRARLRHRAIPRDGLAIRVPAAAVEDLSAARAALEQLTVRTDVAMDARRHGLVERLDVLALRVPGAPDELPEAT